MLTAIAIKARPSRAERQHENSGNNEALSRGRRLRYFSGIRRGKDYRRFANGTFRLRLPDAVHGNHQAQNYSGDGDLRRIRFVKNSTDDDDTRAYHRTAQQENVLANKPTEELVDTLAH